MRAGDLDQRVELLSANSTRDAFGAETPTWSTAATVWAKVSPTSGAEFLEGRQRESQTMAEMRMRYGNTVTTDMRARHLGVTYDILSVRNTDSDQRELVLTCREIGQTQ